MSHSRNTRYIRIHMHECTRVNAYKNGEMYSRWNELLDKNNSVISIFISACRYPRMRPYKYDWCHLRRNASEQHGVDGETVCAINVAKKTS